MPDDVELCRGRARVIAVNNAYQLAAWADVLYSADWKWWNWHKGAPSFQGLKYALTHQSGRWPGVQVLQNAGGEGLSRDPTSLKTGNNSGYQAINLAVHLGAVRVLLLGYDMQGGHFFGRHPDGSHPPFALCLKKFETLVQPLTRAGVAVINCSRSTALRCFPQQSLEQALSLETPDRVVVQQEASC